MSFPKVTLWVWPTGLFPRRIVYYLRAKNITSSILEGHNIQLIPVKISNNAFTTLPGHEVRPPSMSLPVMRVETESDTGIYWVRESIAIMQYFEELFAPTVGYPDLRGATIQQRARTRDLLSLLGDAITWSQVSMIHANPATTAWSGLTEEQMSETAAEHANGKFRGLMGKFEKWVGECDDGSLSGKGERATLADVCLKAHVEYMREMYSVDWLEGFEVLKKWYDSMQGKEWVVAREKLLEVEKTGYWSGVLG